MNGLIDVTLLLMLLMIFFVGHWLYTDIQRRHEWEMEDEEDRAQIKADTDRVARETAALAKVLEQFPIAREDRRLHSVRDNHR